MILMHLKEQELSYQSDNKKSQIINKTNKPNNKFFA